MMTDLNGKIILITGGTSGIGRETAIALAQMGAHVVVSGRSQARGEEGVADIKARSGSNTVDLILADVSSQAAVRQMAAEFMQRYDRLDVLVNNVGYLGAERTESVDSIEMHLAVNHLAPFLLTHELLPILKASAPSRVINVDGGSAVNDGIDFDNLQAEKSFSGLTTYSHAKKVMLAASIEFARQLEGTGVHLNGAYPGAANTNMSQGLSREMFPGVLKLLFPVVKFFVTSAKPEKAAVSSIYLASSSEVEGVNGKYFNTKAKQTDWPSAASADGVPQRVWGISAQLVNLEPDAVVS